MSQRRISFVDLRPGEDSAAVTAALARVVKSGRFVLGPELEAFEQEFAVASGAAHAVGVGNGTDAIALCLRALGVGPGDEVITTPLSAAYTALAVMMAGARPVFVDVDPTRLTLDPSATEDAIGSRTAALLPVHLYGQAADIPAFQAIAQRHNLALVEDCCQAHLGTCGGQPVGTFGAAGAFSFYPTKNLGALGDGGAIITANAGLAERVSRLRNGGQVDRYRHLEAGGVNSRLDELQAAVLRARLPFLSNWTERRRALAGQYRRLLEQAPVEIPPEVDGGHVYHLFVIRSADRDGLRERLTAEGIDTLVHYPIPIPRQPALAAARPTECPIADAITQQLLSLPLYPALDPSAVEAIATAVASHVPDPEVRT